MKKITELTEQRYLTRYKKDEFGNRYRDYEEYTGFKKVITVKSGPRFGHFFVDLICFQLFFLLLEFLIGSIQLIAGEDNFASLTIAFVGSILGLLWYPFLYFICEYKWQQTPGKFLTKTVVIDEYGNKPSAAQIALRSIIRLVPFEAFSCWDDYSYGWHDRWSDTYVVKKEELENIKNLQKEQSEDN